MSMWITKLEGRAPSRPQYRPTRRSALQIWFTAALCLLIAASPANAARQWTRTVKVPGRMLGHGRRQIIYKSIWLPEGAGPVRGLLCACSQYTDQKLVADPLIRKTAADLRLGVLSFYPGMDGKNEYLKQFAEETKHPELTRVPLLLAGHGMGGVTARNAIYMHPDRVISAIHIKCGNLHHHIPDVNRTLAGVPMLSVNGEFEECGPQGGDAGIGLRSKYALDPAKVRSENQTQWVMLRMQLLERRRRNPENMLSMVVERGGNNGSWSPELTTIVAQFIRSTARLRLSDKLPPGDEPVSCRPVKLEDGWLSPGDIKHFKALPAPYAEYKGDRKLAFWYPDFETCEAVFNYHGQGWDQRDPTFGLPAGERFRPPEILQDIIDGPPPRPLAWSGGAGAWSRNGRVWLDGRKRTAWDEKRRAVVDKSGSTVSVTNRMTCTGLTLGPGCTLDMRERSSLSVGWNTVLDDRSVVQVAIAERDRPTRSGRIHVSGRAKIGGKLVVKCDPGNKRYGMYPIVKAGTPLTGAFSEIVVPKGWKGVVQRNAVFVEHVAPPKPKPKPKKPGIEPKDDKPPAKVPPPELDTIGDLDLDL